MPRKAKKGSTRYYFTDKTERAIIRYNNSDNAALRNKIYKEHIDFPFQKLAENIIHTFKFYYFDVSSEDVKHEVVSFLLMNIHKFKEGKGKAFSYFSIVAKNYLILHNNKNYKNYKLHKPVEAMERNQNDWELERQESDEEFVKQMLQYWDNNLTNVFKRQKDIVVADSILELFRRRESIENFNKKALYILVREMTGTKTQHITRIVNIMKKYHKSLHNEYARTGMINVRNTGSLFE